LTSCETSDVGADIPVGASRLSLAPRQILREHSQRGERARGEGRSTSKCWITSALDVRLKRNLTSDIPLTPHPLPMRSMRQLERAWGEGGLDCAAGLGCARRFTCRWHGSPFRLKSDLGCFFGLPPAPRKMSFQPRGRCGIPRKLVGFERVSGRDARLAQRKSTSFTRKGSQVQILQRAPFPPWIVLDPTRTTAPHFPRDEGLVNAP
jgi:hypothetical protein